MSTEELDIQALDISAADDPGIMTSLVDLINAVYAEAEKGLWVPGALRTNVAEIAEFTRNGELFVARRAGRIVGCVRFVRLDDDTSEFGMLVVDPNERSGGIGARLVRWVEAQSLAEGRASMQLELLVPREWSHPFKDYLAGWYGRIGYRVVRTDTIDRAYPHLAPLLAGPTDFMIYLKDLRAS